MTERRALGTVHHDVAVIGQGTWYFDDAHRSTAAPALRRGLDLGMTYTDTAEMYGDAELVVGKAITGRRTEVISCFKGATGQCLPQQDHCRVQALARTPPH